MSNNLNTPLGSVKPSLSFVAFLIVASDIPTAIRL